MSINRARRFVALIAIIMLSLAPVSFAADSPSPISFFDSIVEIITDALNDLFGDDANRSADEEGETEDDGGVPDLNPMVDPNG